MNRRLMLAAFPLAVFGLLGLTAPWLTPYDPTLNDLAATLQAPSRDHLLGTDQLGRDQLSRLLQAARLSLVITAAVLVCSILTGVVLGVLGGYVGGILDRVLVGLIDTTMAVPGLLVALAIIGVRGPGTANIVLALVLTGWAPYARIARAQVRSSRSSVHLDALRVLGAPRRRIVGRHLVPATIGPCIVYASTDLGTVVLAIASMSFLGLGVPPPHPEWGAMLVEARPFLESAWWLAYPPGVAITVVVLAANLLGETLATDGYARPSAFFIGRRAVRSRVRPEGIHPGAAGPEEGGRAGTTPPPMRGVYEIRSLNVRYADERVVADVDLRLEPGEIMALVGESGSGKTSTALGPIGLLGWPAEVAGSARLLTDEGVVELIGAQADLQALYGREVGVVFQDSTSALNPLRTVGSSLDQAIRASGYAAEPALVRARREHLLGEVGLAQAARRYPHELSGGMRQRVQLAIAVAGDPRLLIADEPTSALDVTVQAEILALLMHLRDQTGAAILLVTHDLGVVSQVADTVAVAYAGRIVERGPVARILTSPDHPYTKGLLAAVPDVAVAPRTPFVTLPGAPGAGPDSATGCSFSARCRLVQPACLDEVPALDPVGGDQWSRCLRHPSGRPPRAVVPRGGVRA